MMKRKVFINVMLGIAYLVYGALVLEFIAAEFGPVIGFLFIFLGMICFTFIAKKIQQTRLYSGSAS